MTAKPSIHLGFENHDLPTQLAILKRDEELGVAKPNAVKRRFRPSDCAQRDYDDEAAAHGIHTSELFERGN